MRKQWELLGHGAAIYPASVALIKKDYVNINMEINSSGGFFFTYSYLSLLFILYLHLKIVNIFSAKIFIGA